jgi:hypothetical protein
VVLVGLFRCLIWGGPMLSRRKKDGPEPNVTGMFPGSEYTEEELRFAKMVERWKHKHDVKFPSFVQLFRLAKVFLTQALTERRGREGRGTGR